MLPPWSLLSDQVIVHGTVAFIPVSMNAIPSCSLVSCGTKPESDLFEVGDLWQRIWRMNRIWSDYWLTQWNALLEMTIILIITLSYEFSIVISSEKPSSEAEGIFLPNCTKLQTHKIPPNTKDLSLFYLITGLK